MDSNYVATLKKVCSQTDNTTIVQMDPGSSKVFDTGYFTVVTKRRGLFRSDAALLNNKETSDYIKLHSNTSKVIDSTFFKDFADSMVKMGRIGVLTGNQGEIRRVCTAIN